MKTFPPHAFAAAVLAAMAVVDHVAYAQNATADLDAIAVIARPSDDSIVLRWAPRHYSTWQAAIKSGYKIERYVMARDGKLVLNMEKTVLNDSVMPWPEESWEKLVHNDPYAAIAAQALYGDRFEVDLQQANIFTIVDKVKENEQRYSFTLFASDMSPATANACGLLYTDRQVKSEEKYLYRIMINGQDTLRGSVFVCPSDLYYLPSPQNLQAEFKEHSVFLKWERQQSNLYAAFIIERSTNGAEYERVSNLPVVTASPGATSDSRYEYAIDSLPDLSATYYYRVKGLTSFGEESPPSDPVCGEGFRPVERVPYILSADNVDNQSIIIQWDFPETSNDAITGFRVERAPSPTDHFIILNDTLLTPEKRKFEDHCPNFVNYYRVLAIGIRGESYSSHLYFAQLVDSIPPSVPTGLNGSISDSGAVTLWWKPNSESDIYGYRIYKAFHQSEEPAQLSDFPISAASFIDSIDLNTLNENVYYQVMAIDINQNHSRLSERLKVPLPDKTRPQAPVLLPVKIDSSGILLSWVRGASEDILAYRIFRKVPGHATWLHLKTVEAAGDSIFAFKDGNAVSGVPNYYTILAVDDAGLESVPVNAVSAVPLGTTLRPPITWKKQRINKADNQIVLTWVSPHSIVRLLRIFRAMDNSSPILLATVGGDTSEYTDSVIPMHVYSYRIMAVFENGQQSLLSDELKVEY